MIIIKAFCVIQSKQYARPAACLNIRYSHKLVGYYNYITTQKGILGIAAIYILNQFSYNSENCLIMTNYGKFGLFENLATPTLNQRKTAITCVIFKPEHSFLLCILTATRQMINYNFITYA